MQDMSSYVLQETTLAQGMSSHVSQETTFLFQPSCNDLHGITLYGMTVFEPMYDSPYNGFKPSSHINCVVVDGDRA